MLIVNDTRLSISYGPSIKNYYRDKKNIANFIIDAASQKSGNGVTILKENGIEEFISYSRVLKDSVNKLGGLQKAGLKKGDVVLLVINENSDFISTFWACLLGGIIPAPLASPTSFKASNTPLNKIISIWNLTDKAVIIGNTSFEEKRRDIEELYGVSGMKVMDVSNLDTGNEGLINLADTSSTAFIQFSSGSTNVPKGVVLKHSNLLVNLEAIIRAANFTPNDRFLSWMPFHHDMGLIGFMLTSAVLGCNFYNMSPMRFVKRPLYWLDMINKHKATITGSPNFGYRMVLRELDRKEGTEWDLSSVRAIFNGAEPISVELMNQFNERLASSKLSKTAVQPVYGMAEACLAVSFPILEDIPVAHGVDRHLLAAELKANPCEDKSRTVFFADEGYPVPGIDIRIVDAEGTLVPEKTVGEIQIKGSNVTSGYYNNPSVNDVSFCNGWLKTGDMGYMTDGRLVVTGRIKDIIFVNGQNYYAHDIENKICRMENTDANKVAVCGMHDHIDGTEKVVLFTALKIKDEAASEFYSDMVKLVNDEVGILIDYVVQIPSVPKTTSGKIQRFKMVEDFLDGKYKDHILYQSMGTGIIAKPDRENRSEPQHSVENNLDAFGIQRGTKVHIGKANGVNRSCTDIIREIWAEILELPEESISPKDLFTAIGGTSVKAYRMLVMLEDRLNIELTHDILMECRTIEDMQEYLQRGKLIS